MPSAWGFESVLARSDLLLLSLTRDGRLANPRPFDSLLQRLPSATDCFVFCHGWLNDQAEAREGAQRFLGHLDVALRPVGERVVPLHVALHWPSKPFANGEAAGTPPAQSRPWSCLVVLASWGAANRACSRD